MKRIPHKFLDGKEHAWCSHHKKYEPITNFHKDKYTWGGIKQYCKPHACQIKREYRLRNLTARKMYDHNYRKSNRDKINKQRQKYIKTKSGFEAIKKVETKRRALGFNMLVENDWNEPVEWHHVNDGDVVPLPTYLHRMCVVGNRKEHRELANKLVGILYPNLGV